MSGSSKRGLGFRDGSIPCVAKQEIRSRVVIRVEIERRRCDGLGEDGGRKRSLDQNQGRLVDGRFYMCVVAQHTPDSHVPIFTHLSIMRCIMFSLGVGKNINGRLRISKHCMSGARLTFLVSLKLSTSCCLLVRYQAKVFWRHCSTAIEYFPFESAEAVIGLEGSVNAECLRTDASGLQLSILIL